MTQLEYTVTPIDAAAHRIRVHMRAPAQAGRALRLHLASWIPGSYVIRDFARHLLSISAACDDAPIEIVSRTRQAWECTPTGETLDVVCEFHARDESVRAAFLDDRRGFFNFTSVALRPEGMGDMPCRVTLAPPVDIDDWQVVTTLPADDIDAFGFGVYQTTSYWDLIDHPVAMGRSIERVEFTVRDVPHAFVLLGSHDADTRQLGADLTAICEAQAQVFDALPAREYLFFAQITPSGFGGLEHRESSVLQVARNALPSVVADNEKRSETYETLLGLCSHEYFHLWNVKRIRPAVVASNNLEDEAYFRDLWAYEGVTSYYDDLGLVRAGVIDEQSYLDRLAQLATRIERNPGRRRQSLSQSSFDAWLKFYRPDENTPNAVVSYYGKGAQLSLALDLKLRKETDGRVCLDDIMRAMWIDYGQHDTPVPENGLAGKTAEVSGLDLEDFFALHLNTTADAPWADALADFGIAARCVPATDDTAILIGRVGVRLSADAMPRVTHVLDDTPARAAGISSGDRLVAFDGLEANNTLATRLARYPAGAQVELHLFRGDELLVRHITLAADAAPQWRLTIDDEADESCHARRARWLHRDRAAA